ncbi:MAG: hypothetical protein B6U97_03235 [Candidatus Altiarchaeales archaeon ex4484_96]|nr:MAG: hypothetical protein B6U97_03235 [Candidatus Altiarchaeales archaeon ex4484_96]
MDLISLLVSAAALLFLGLLFLLFIVGILSSVFGIALGFLDFLLDPLFSFYYRFFGKKEDAKSKDYSIEQGEEVS